MASNLSTEANKVFKDLAEFAESAEANAQTPISRNAPGTSNEPK